MLISRSVECLCCAISLQIIIIAHQATILQITLPSQTICYLRLHGLKWWAPKWLDNIPSTGQYADNQSFIKTIQCAIVHLYHTVCNRVQMHQTFQTTIIKPLPMASSNCICSLGIKKFSYYEYSGCRVMWFLCYSILKIKANIKSC